MEDDRDDQDDLADKERIKGEGKKTKAQVQENEEARQGQAYRGG